MKSLMISLNRIFLSVNALGYIDRIRHSINTDNKKRVITTGMMTRLICTLSL
ncbi:MAG: hypothetical protein HRT53_05075 [Colwellia sp.]|nr:hypothetical protein [Colwellia sp.]